MTTALALAASCVSLHPIQPVVTFECGSQYRVRLCGLAVVEAHRRSHEREAWQPHPLALSELELMSLNLEVHRQSFCFWHGHAAPPVITGLEFTFEPGEELAFSLEQTALGLATAIAEMTGKRTAVAVNGLPKRPMTRTFSVVTVEGAVKHPRATGLPLVVCYGGTETQRFAPDFQRAILH